MLFRSSYRYGAAAFLFYGSPRGSHFAKRCDVVPWGFTQIACHSRGNPTHHRASARMRATFFRKKRVLMLFRSSFRYGAAAFFFYGSPSGSHFAKRCDVVPWGFIQMAGHSRGNPSHHRASARMSAPLFRKIVFSCVVVPPVGTAPRHALF